MNAQLTEKKTPEVAAELSVPETDRGFRGEIVDVEVVVTGAERIDHGNGPAQEKADSAAEELLIPAPLGNALVAPHDDEYAPSKILAIAKEIEAVLTAFKRNSVEAILRVAGLLYNMAVSPHKETWCKEQGYSDFLAYRNSMIAELGYGSEGYRIYIERLAPNAARIHAVASGLSSSQLMAVPARCIDPEQVAIIFENLGDQIRDAKNPRAAGNLISGYVLEKGLAAPPKRARAATTFSAGVADVESAGRMLTQPSPGTATIGTALTLLEAGLENKKGNNVAKMMALVEQVIVLLKEAISQPTATD
jgi:hypothetical protein